MEAELRCPVCCEYFEDPVMLNCTHHICMQHIGAGAGAGAGGAGARGQRDALGGSTQGALAQRERIACPVCGDLTGVPEGGLRVDRTLQVVVDTWRSAATQDGGASGSSEAKPTCGFCEEKPATRRCIQCSGVLCEECEKTSHSKGFFKTHNIVNLSDDTSGPIDFAGRMVCDEHHDEKLSFYCLDCRKPVCSHCLILGEHQGHQQTPIDQAFETGKETLGAWVDKLTQRIQSTEALLEQLRASELEVNRGAEAQRSIINHEMDHLRELIETKRQQLMSKSALEEKQKRVQLQGQVGRADSARQDARGLVTRSQDLLALKSEHAFLALVLPLIQDMKKCAGQPVDDAPRVSTLFRPLSTDAQVRSLGDLDLGHPRPPQHVASVQSIVSPGAPGIMQQGHVALDGQQQMVMQPGYNVANATLPYVPQQPMPVQQVQYVYRTVATQ
mmetsp:Transcript_86244/g.268289  ORF Transcript_86244/g.268289 Transcript_86244/m.268289 type:complete len:444 (-) Transcript_86244:82-1413(-)